MRIAAGRFKAECLRLMDEVRLHHTTVLVTKRGKPVARLVSAEPAPRRRIFGYLKGSVRAQGDLIAPVGETWDAQG